MRNFIKVMPIMLVLAFESGHLKRIKKVFKSISTLCALNKDLEGLQPI